MAENAQMNIRVSPEYRAKAIALARALGERDGASAVVRRLLYAWVDEHETAGDLPDWWRNHL